MKRDGRAPVLHRRPAREAAFHALYAIAVGRASLEEALADAEERAGLTGPLAEFLHGLVTRTAGDLFAAEARFSDLLAAGWTLERLAQTDRLLLCLACDELWNCPDVPPKVTLSEYVGLAKRYGGAESGRFVNGVLGAALPRSPKADWVEGAVPEAEPEPPSPLDAEEHRPEDDPAEELSEESGDDPGGVRAGAWVIRADSQES